MPDRAAPGSPRLRLIADIGGTHARFAVCRPGASPPEPTVYVCGQYRDIGLALAVFLEAEKSHGAPDDAALAVAGPVIGGTIAMTNHPWRFEAEELRRSLGLPRLRVVNDFTAIALSLPHLESSQWRRIGGGEPVAGSAMGVLGPGTGFGVSGLLPSAGSWTPISGEGGHVDFAPVGERECEIFWWLSARFEHVSLERVLSGPGLLNLFHAVAEIDGTGAEAVTPAAVVERSRTGECRTSLRAVAHFCDILGGAAGNLALTLGARAGVFIAGGVVPKLGNAFAADRFRDRFQSKGRYKSYLEAIPTSLLTVSNPALIGLSHLSDEAVSAE